ncbi:MAG: dTDP-4-dehydrorhamnose reductase [Patescibacteria group bacterium]
MKFKIILFGADGQLGKALKQVLSVDFEVSTFGKKDLDITNSEEVENVCDKSRPDFLVNAAAYTAVDHAESERELALKINSDAVGNLARIAKKIGAKLIHFSTDYVFDGKPQAQTAEAQRAKAGENFAGYLENDAPNPVNFYGASKLAGEQKILESGCDFAIVRTSWLFGDGQNFVKKMLELAKEKAEIKVVSDQIGCPTFTEDLAKMTLEIILNCHPESSLCHSRESGNPYKEIFHATNSGATSWANFARKIFELKNLPTKVIDIPTSEFPTPARRPRNSILRNSKLPEMRKWEDALAEYLQSL